MAGLHILPLFRTNTTQWVVNVVVSEIMKPEFQKKGERVGNSGTQALKQHLLGSALRSSMPFTQVVTSLIGELIIIQTTGGHCMSVSLVNWP